MANRNSRLTKKEKAAAGQAEREKAEAGRKAAEEAALAKKRKRGAIIQICAGIALIFAAGLALSLFHGRPQTVPATRIEPEPAGVRKFSETRMQPLFRMSCGLVDNGVVELAVTVGSSCDFGKFPQGPVRDAALMLLSGKTSGEALYGKDMIRAELTGWLNRAVGENCVKNLYPVYAERPLPPGRG